MNRFELMTHYRSAFRQGGFNEARIKELREEAFKVLTPAVIKKVPPPYFTEEEEAAYAAKYRAFSDEERAAYKAPPSEYRAFSAAHRAAYAAIGKSLEWNLTIDGDLGATGDYAFFFTATASDSVLTPSQQSAAALLYATLEALEEKALSDRVSQNILDALLGLDSDSVEGRKKSSKALVIARIKTAINKKKRTEERYSLWRKWAKEYVKQFPYSKPNDTAYAVFERAKQHVPPMHIMVNGNKYSLKTIESVITGTKKASKMNR